MSLQEAGKGIVKIPLMRINPVSRVPMPWIKIPNEKIKDPYFRRKITMPSMFVGNNVEDQLQLDLPYHHI